MNPFVALSIFLLSVLAAAAISKRVSGTMITLPMVYVVIGLLLSDMALDVSHFANDGPAVRIIAELTLVLVLAADASRISVSSMFRYHAMLRLRWTC